MNSTILKKLNTALPSSVKRLLGPYIRRKLFVNPIFQDQLAELALMETEPLAVIKKKQFEKLKELLIYAYEHTEYYKGKFDECGFDVYHFSDTEEMNKIPPIKKTDIIQNFAALQTDDVTDFYLTMTGGSSGASLKILLDKDSIYRERAFIYHFWSKYGYDYQTSKIASFRGGIDFKGKLHKFNPLYHEIQLNPCLINGETINDYLRLIHKFNPQFIHGLPSAIYSFCKYASKAAVDLRNQYKAIFFISENVYPYQRELIEETFSLKTYAYYGHTERAVFAEQFGEGYRFHDYYGYVELEDGQEGGIITTGFINRKMPLIRYELDDHASRLEDTDLFEITGHRDGILYGRNGEIISAASLYIHNETMDQVANQQFVQEEVGKVKMLICPIKEISETGRKKISDYYQEKLGTSIDIEVKITQDMIFTSRGKMPLIVQKSPSV